MVLDPYAVLAFLKGEAAASEVGGSSPLATLRSLRWEWRKCWTISCVSPASTRRTPSLTSPTDPHLLDVCRAEGIAFEVLPAANGSRWSPTTFSICRERSGVAARSGILKLAD
jgi:hypothetical protein